MRTINSSTAGTRTATRRASHGQRATPLRQIAAPETPDAGVQAILSTRGMGVFSTGRIVKTAGPLEHAPVPLLWSAPKIEPVAFSWLITVRWTTLAAGVGAGVAGGGG